MGWIASGHRQSYLFRQLERMQNYPEVFVFCILVINQYVSVSAFFFKDEAEEEESEEDEEENEEEEEENTD